VLLFAGADEAESLATAERAALSPPPPHPVNTAASDTKIAVVCSALFTTWRKSFMVTFNGFSLQP